MRINRDLLKIWMDERVEWKNELVKTSQENKDGPSADLRRKGVCLKKELI